jgi:hypothetical protein
MSTIVRFKHKWIPEDVVEEIPNSTAILFIQETPISRHRMYSKEYPTWEDLEKEMRLKKDDFIKEAA